ncbi:MraY family glycosyltransferase [Sphingobacterium spiritivorum]|uniref:MraY family glycosyltransferase n=1 Tax=Sphingobacterium spiritivorum TaxID=258 RepID=UPI001917DFA5|nr:MraY family glycosyltransferase [Sphingobacterium spiritivorum]QQT25890.1 undecaprenyl/decaprenyl-phosphate alpha-N-acetylglucosaminyl 1-phosphate transferase [Sphingobacterium spiritivorum]
MEILIVFVIPFVLAVLLSKWIIPYIMLITYKKRLFDPVDSRKHHQRIIPRLGGVAFAPIQCCVLVITLVVIYKMGSYSLDLNIDVKSWIIVPMLMMLVCGLVILFLVGIADDLIGMDYKWKFITQLFVASLLPVSGLWINDMYGILFITSLSPWVGIPLTLFAVVLIINAVNLMDGLDGLCSGAVAIGAVVLGSMFIFYGAWLHAMFAFITAGVLLPFFYFNVFGIAHRRRQIFMGDTGSLTLGYSIAFLAISFAMNNSDIKPFSEGAIVAAFSTLIVPVFDVARVMFIRWRNKKPLFKPDRNHLHHKLLHVGLSHRQAMLVILGMALFFCLVNGLAVHYISNNIVVLADIVLWICFQYAFDKIGKIKSKRLVDDRAPVLENKGIGEEKIGTSTTLYQSADEPFSMSSE